MKNTRKTRITLLLCVAILLLTVACGGEKAAVYYSYSVGKVTFSAGNGYTLMGWNMTAVEEDEDTLADGPLSYNDEDGQYTFTVIGEPGDRQEFTLYYCPEGKEDEEKSITAIVTKGDDGAVSFEWKNLPDGVLAMK